MGVGEKCDSRVLSFCKALGVEYRASEALWWHYTELSVLLETQPKVNCKSNSSHSSCSFSFPTESQSLAMWSKWLSVSHPNLGNGRHYNSAFKTHLLKAKWNKTTATFKTHTKRRITCNWRKDLVPFNSTVIVPLLVLDFCAFFLSLFEAIKIFLDNCFLLSTLVSNNLVGFLSNCLKSHSTGGRGAKPSFLMSNLCPFPRTSMEVLVNTE